MFALTRALFCALPRLPAPLMSVAPCVGAAVGAVRHLAFHQGTFRTPSSVKKRFRVTPAGAIVRGKGGKSHLNYHKSSAHVNRLSATVALSGGIRARYLRALQLSPLRR